MLNPNFYLHESDRQALQALQAIPGFTQLLQAFMKVWSEKQFRIENLSSNLRISEKQLPKYYAMLLPICKKLGIEVPELYLTREGTPNAYTGGDTKPFIIITSGLLKTMPDEVIATVLAHECGHIACHHCLYTMMGKMILEGTISTLGLGDLVNIPLKSAFYRWMRCSELSADRAAAICDGTADNVVSMCLYFAGINKSIAPEINVEEFMNQALEYRDMVQESVWNSTLTFLFLSNKDHPMNAVRAYECTQWAKDARFAKILAYLEASRQPLNQGLTISQFMQEVPMPKSAKHYIGKHISEVRVALEELGFSNVTRERSTVKSLMVKDGQVLSISINGRSSFEAWEWFPLDAAIVISYFEPETEAEIAAAHPGLVRAPNYAMYYLVKTYQETENEFRAAGFSNIVLEEQKKSKKGLLSKNGGVLQVTINGQNPFSKGDWFDRAAVVRIVYQTFADGGWNGFL